MHSLRSPLGWGRDISRWLFFVLLFFLFIAGCDIWGTENVKVWISFTDANTAELLKDVSVIVGGDKFFWHGIPAGTVERVTLRPGELDNRQLTLIYTQNDLKKYWEGPEFEAGTNYRIEIKIDAKGIVSQRHCFQPCSLD